MMKKLENNFDFYFDEFFDNFLCQSTHINMLFFDKIIEKLDVFFVFKKIKDLNIIGIFNYMSIIYIFTKKRSFIYNFKSLFLLGNYYYSFCVGVSIKKYYNILFFFFYFNWYFFSYYIDSFFYQLVKLSKKNSIGFLWNLKDLLFYGEEGYDDVFLFVKEPIKFIIWFNNKSNNKFLKKKCFFIFKNLLNGFKYF